MRQDKWDMYVWTLLNWICAGNYCSHLHFKESCNIIQYIQKWQPCRILRHNHCGAHTNTSNPRKASYLNIGTSRGAKLSKLQSSSSGSSFTTERLLWSSSGRSRLNSWCVAWTRALSSSQCNYTNDDCINYDEAHVAFKWPKATSLNHK